jgi:hypothetical protein
VKGDKIIKLVFDQNFSKKEEVMMHCKIIRMLSDGDNLLKQHKMEKQKISHHQA